MMCSRDDAHREHSYITANRRDFPFNLVFCARIFGLLQIKAMFSWEWMIEVKREEDVIIIIIVR